jgi:dihydroneopterin aldolase
VTTVYIEGLEFYGYHGVSDTEQTIGHRYDVSVHLTVDEQAGASDDVDQTVDYGAIAQLIEDIFKEQHYRTVERLASVIAESLFFNFLRVEVARIKVGKKAPPIPQIAAEAGVEVVVQRPPDKK